MLRTFKTLGDLTGKTVLVRVNLDVAGIPDRRIDQATPFLKELVGLGAKIVILSHRGRPKGQDENLSLRPVFEELRKQFGGKISFEKGESEILLLENLRFDTREEANDESFAKELASLGDVYINNDFATSHRAHTSIVGIPKFLPAAAGPLIIKEVSELSAIREVKEQPLVFLLGGAKPETKLPVIKNFLDRADSILVGGVIANTFFKSKGLEVGKSVVGDITEVSEITNHNKIILPTDVVVSKSLDRAEAVATKSVNSVTPDDYIVDIGPETHRAFAEILGGAARTVWNGALGRFEVKDFAAGSRACADAMVQSAAHTTVGGGDTIQFLEQEGLLNKFEFVSAGGGAMLAFLADAELPGLKVLEE